MPQPALPLSTQGAQRSSEPRLACENTVWTAPPRRRGKRRQNAIGSSRVRQGPYGGRRTFSGRSAELGDGLEVHPAGTSR